MRWPETLAGTAVYLNVYCLVSKSLTGFVTSVLGLVRHRLTLRRELDGPPDEVAIFSNICFKVGDFLKFFLSIIAVDLLCRYDSRIKLYDLQN